MDILLLPQAIIYVVDCTDKVRMCVAKDEMETLLSHDDLVNEDVPVLFFANKVGGMLMMLVRQLLDP